MIPSQAPAAVTMVQRLYFASSKGLGDDQSKVELPQEMPSTVQQTRKMVH